MKSDTIDWEVAMAELTAVLQQNAPFSETAQQALHIGKTALGVENGYLTNIVPGLNHWEIVASTDSEDGQFPSGLELDLRTTFCRHTIDREATVALHDAPEQGWADDIAYRTHGVHCYLGVPFQPNDTLVGTVCFVAQRPRSEPFTDAEIAFVEHLAALLETHFQLQKHLLAMDNYTKLTGILSRLLRHNLRNDLTVIQGHVDLLIKQLDQPQVDPSKLRATLNRLIALAEKSHELRRMAEWEPTFDEQAVTALVREQISTIEAEYPDVSFTLTGPEGVKLPILPSLSIAVRELLENVAEHAGDRPYCAVTIEPTPQGVTIEFADDGPGLPEHEQAVLDGEVETVLNHGSGVGLWLVWWAVDAHNGRIQTEVSATGTTVTVSIPRPAANGAVTGHSV